MKVHSSVIALHPLTFAQEGRNYTRAQLAAHGETLSYKPLSVNHGSVPEYQCDPYSRVLDYPDNRCLSFAYSQTLDALVGKVELVKDSMVDQHVQNGEIRFVSCENYRHGESLEFRGLTLLRKNRTPRDTGAVIVPESRELVS